MRYKPTPVKPPPIKVEWVVNSCINRMLSEQMRAFAETGIPFMAKALLVLESEEYVMALFNDSERRMRAVYRQPGKFQTTYQEILSLINLQPPAETPDYSRI